MSYAPDDSRITPEALAFLHGPQGRPLREKALAPFADHGEPSVSDITQLRKSFPAEAVHAALTLAKLQAKARQKLPNLAGHFIYATSEALEQATDWAVAAHKASRFAAAIAHAGLENPHILDLCSGIGGDAIALANIAPTTAIDLSAARLACLRYNLESAPAKHPLQTHQADVTDLDHLVTLSPCHPLTLFHIDPARRNAGKRSNLYENLIPGPEFLEKLINSFPGGAVKLSSAADFDSLPQGHLEIISHNHSVVQAVLYVGSLDAQNRTRSVSEGLRTATLFENHQLTFTFTAPPTPPSLRPASPITNYQLPITGPTPFLYEADPAFTRAQLAAPLAESLGLIPLTSDAGYLLGQAPLIRHPALSPFELLQVIPYSENRVIEALRKLPSAAPGPVEVKTRGRIPGIDTDQLQLRFAKATPYRYTILIFRQDSQILAALASRPALA